MVNNNMQKTWTNFHNKTRQPFQTYRTFAILHHLLWKNAHFERVKKVISIHFMLRCHFPFRWVWCFCLISCWLSHVVCYDQKRMNCMCSTAHALSFPILLNGFTLLILVEMRFAIAYAWELVANILMIFPLVYMAAHRIAHRIHFI